MASDIVFTGDRDGKCRSGHCRCRYNIGTDDDTFLHVQRSVGKRNSCICGKRVVRIYLFQWEGGMKIFARLKGNLNIKEKWQDICAIEFKKKIKIVLVFLGIMAGLTVLSRITYNMILPEVVMGQAEPGTVTMRYRPRRK